MFVVNRRRLNEERLRLVSRRYTRTDDLSIT
jgi:hypothetical protein